MESKKYLLTLSKSEGVGLALHCLLADGASAKSAQTGADGLADDLAAKLAVLSCLFWCD